MGERPPGHSLERIDNDGDYTPTNCRWATRKEQCRNTNRNRYLEAWGKTKTLSEWAELVGIETRTVHARLKRGWDVEKALSIDPKKYHHR